MLIFKSKVKKMEEEYELFLQEIIEKESYQQLKNFIHHGKVSTYELLLDYVTNTLRRKSLISIISLLLELPYYTTTIFTIGTIKVSGISPMAISILKLPYKTLSKIILI